MPLRSKQVFRSVAASVVLVLAAVTLFVGYTAYQSRLRYDAEASSSSRNLARALRYALQSHFEEVDLALRRANREFGQMHSEGRFSADQFSAYLRSLKERIPQADAIRGSDEHGKVVYGEQVDPKNPVDLSIREFYQRALTERSLVFGVPVKSRISGDMVFPLMLALTYPDGRFGGTAYVNMASAGISETIESLNLGPHGVISLIDTGRRLLHRYPEIPGAIDGKPSALSSNIIALMERGGQQATYSATSGIDGETRRYSVERVADYPIYIVVGLAEQDYMQPWRREVLNAVGFLLVLYVLAAALLGFLRVSLQRHQRAVGELVRKEASLQASLAALTDSEARFRSLTEGLPQMVWTTRDMYRFEFLSHHWSEYTGLATGALQDAAAFAAIIHPDDRQLVADAWSAALDSGGEMRCACRLRRHDGSWRLFDHHALPQRDAAGVVSGWVGSSTDITEQREQHDALMLAKDQALAAGRAKSDFLANMSHEIRSPMHAVLGMLQLLQRTELDTVQRDYADKAGTSARALLGILNDILDFSKIEEGKLTLDPQPFSVDNLLRELAVILSANASGKDIEVLFNVSPDLPRWIEGDALRLQQVLLNLAGNAIKFTQRGEVVLSVTPHPGFAERIDVHFCVRDTGIGIAPEHLAHIFDGFSQAEASTARRFGGTGLGLAISQRLVALMGGHLRVESRPGVGSTFEFTIPMRRTAQQNDRPPHHGLQHLRCLIVDDNATGREVLAAIAASFGWRVDSVASGAQALAAARVTPYDVVLLDWRMPEMDGWEAGKLLRQQALPGLMPLVIMVTAHDRELVAATNGRIAPVLDAMLAKPVTASVLFDTVAELRLGGAKAPQPADLPAAVLPPALERRLEGLRLLVVDDNAINLQVARELLSAAGARVEVADGGHTAVAAVCGSRFDLVLMDIQMPDMDGYAATAAIHARIGDNAPPIVAMTANAMASDRDAAHAAGMADHVGKPFDIEQLIGVILQLVRPAPAGARRQGLNSAAALARLGGSLNVYQTALRGFDGEIERLAAQLAAARDDGQVQHAAAALHLVRGLAGMVGADQLATLSLEAERQLKHGASWDGVAQVLGEAQHARQAAAEHLQTLASRAWPGA